MNFHHHPPIQREAEKKYFKAKADMIEAAFEGELDDLKKILEDPSLNIIEEELKKILDDRTFNFIDDVRGSLSFACESVDRWFCVDFPLISR